MGRSVKSIHALLVVVILTTSPVAPASLDASEPPIYTLDVAELSVDGDGPAVERYYHEVGLVNTVNGTELLLESRWALDRPADAPGGYEAEFQLNVHEFKLDLWPEAWVYYDPEEPDNSEVGANVRLVGSATHHASWATAATDNGILLVPATLTESIHHRLRVANPC
jgi:hypothetical protein